ncbi:MAG: hypothetical protein ACD_81C00173G0001 [uncultured bacterium]|nr:MAG: hypothetical protein ACD_81C00173G0001 [uncultured bacterium]
METRHIKSREPHITNNHQLKGIVWVFETVSYTASHFFICIVRLKLFWIGRIGSHHNLNCSLIQIITMPLWANGNYFFIQLYCNPSAHRHNHRLTDIHLLPCFKVSYEVFCNLFHSLSIADNRFQLRPLRLRLFFRSKLHPFGYGFNFCIYLSTLLFR